MEPETDTLTPEMLANIRSSGITDATIAAAGIIPANEGDLRAGKEGYRIPYFDVDGDPTVFYRVRVTSISTGPKYVAPQGQGNHIYVPPSALCAPETWRNAQTPILVVEGEKKALKAAQEGFATLGLGGVDSWRSRTVQIPDQALDEGTRKNHKTLKLPSSLAVEQIVEQVAPELGEIVFQDRSVTIVFDTDSEHGVRPEVQRAAFDLAIWLDSKGAIVTQLVLPSGGGKVGIDDFLVARGAGALAELLAQRLKFPPPVDPKTWVQRTLNGKPDREDLRKLARGVLASLDAHGQRYVSADHTAYYVNQRDRSVHEFSLRTSDLREFRVTPFGGYVMRKFGIGSADEAALKRIADQYLLDSKEITPRTVNYAADNIYYHQLSDSRVVKVTPTTIETIDNGEEGVLFRPGRVVPLDESLLRQALDTPQPTENRWISSLREYNVVPMHGMTADETRLVLAALFHISPYLQRWRGMMLPLEIAQAEPGSGKSMLFQLRRFIFEGVADPHNVPGDMRDFYAAVANTSFWCLDNASKLPHDLQATLSDELCRLITAHQMGVEMRRLFTTNESVRIPINTTFAVTAVDNPFHRADLLQRSVSYGFHEIKEGDRNSEWLNQRLAERAYWFADHLRFIQSILTLAQSDWRVNYRSSNRLVHFEQSLTLALRVLGQTREEAQEIVRRLARHSQAVISEEDHMLRALAQFAEYSKEKGHQEADVSTFTTWASLHDTWDSHQYMHKVTHVQKYLKSHEGDVQRSTGITVSIRHRLPVMKFGAPPALELTPPTNQRHEEVA